VLGGVWGGVCWPLKAPAGVVVLGGVAIRFDKSHGVFGIR